MTVAFDREGLLGAFDEIGEAAMSAGAMLELALYGGSALMLASSFRFATEARFAMLQAEPARGGDARLDALLAAIAEYLAKQHRLGRVPSWVADPGRVLAEPWFTGADDSDGMREYLVTVSPAEFIHHNIFTDAAPLRRARQRAEP